MTDRNIELTRRKILGAAGAVGVAGAGAGLGTTALFSDEESFTNNSITAGTLDMSVTAEIVEASEYYTSSGDGPNIIGDMETADGEAVVGLQASDVKPGDWVIICFEIDIGDNPGYVQISTDDFAQYENGQTEPEAIVDNTGGGSLGTPLDGQGNGELQDELLAEVYGGYDDMMGGDPPRSYLSDPEPSLSGSARTTYEQFATGVVIGGPADPLEVGSGDDAIKRYLLLELPVDVGNEVQSDAIEFDLVFDALQVRNNDGFDPSSSLVGYWPLNDVENAPVKDISGNGNDGTVVGSSVTSVDGQVANAVELSESGGYINIGSSSYKLSDTLTETSSLATWIRTTQTGNDTMWKAPGITGVESSGDGNDIFWGWLDASGKIGIQAGDDDAAMSTTQVDDGAWHHVAFTYDASTGDARVFVDGTEEDTATTRTDDITTEFSCIGRIEDTAGSYEDFVGNIDDVRVYDRTLSSSEVQQIYDSTENL